MRSLEKNIFVAALSLFAGGATTSSALVVMLSDLAPVGSPLEAFLNANFTNVTQIRHANYALFSGAAAQDALNGTGAFAGMGAADVVIIGRSLGSADYDNFDAAGYNGLSIPVVNLTSYTARQDGNRMGWHASGATGGTSVAGAETTVTAAGAGILGLAAGPHDLVSEVSLTDSTFNGLAAGTTAFGGGSILATVGLDTLSVYWPTGSAPGNPTAATVATFAGPRLLFNLDNDPNVGNNGLNDLNNLTAEGRQALIRAIDFATPLTSIPEPSAALLGLGGLAYLARRRRSA